MSDRRQKWLTVFASILSIFITLGGTSALARLGGGEHFQSDSHDSGGDGASW